MGHAAALAATEISHAATLAARPAIVNVADRIHRRGARSICTDHTVTSRRHFSA
jgi:hypothetical protein